jgi:hypothetical protein
MVLDPEPEHRVAPTISLFSLPGLVTGLLAVSLVVLFLWWGGLWRWGQIAAAALGQ